MTKRQDPKVKAASTRENGYAEEVSISRLKANPSNPRIMRDDRFAKLKKSITEFPDMMNKRPIVAVTDVDGKLMVLGGNMRLRACQDLVLKFEEPPIPFREVLSSVHGSDEHRECSELYFKYWHETKVGQHLGKFKAATKKLHPDRVAYTMAAQAGWSHFHPHEPRQISRQEVCMLGTYPVDYAFGEEVWHYLIGMSVPPVMTAQIAHQINLQWFSLSK